MSDFETHPIGTSEYINKLEKALSQISNLKEYLSEIDLDNNDLSQEDRKKLRSYLNHHLLI